MNLTDHCLAVRSGIGVTVTVLDIIHRPVFYLKHTVDNIRTSQEAHHVSAMSPTGL
jgi:hypothetical protein